MKPEVSGRKGAFQPAVSSDEPTGKAEVRVLVSSCLLGEPVRYDGGHAGPTGALLNPLAGGGSAGAVLSGGAPVGHPRRAAGTPAVVCEPGDGVVIPAGPDHRHMGRALTEMVRVVFFEDV
jgi:hypothetical protein